MGTVERFHLKIEAMGIGQPQQGITEYLSTGRTHNSCKASKQYPGYFMAVFVSSCAAFQARFVSLSVGLKPKMDVDLQGVHPG